MFCSFHGSITLYLCSEINWYEVFLIFLVSLYTLIVEELINNLVLLIFHNHFRNSLQEALHYGPTYTSKVFVVSTSPSGPSPTKICNMMCLNQLQSSWQLSTKLSGSFLCSFHGPRTLCLCSGKLLSSIHCRIYRRLKSSQPFDKADFRRLLWGSMP